MGASDSKPTSNPVLARIEQEAVRAAVPRGLRDELSTKLEYDLNWCYTRNNWYFTIGAWRLHQRFETHACLCWYAFRVSARAAAGRSLISPKSCHVGGLVIGSALGFMQRVRPISADLDQLKWFLSPALPGPSFR